MSEVTNSRSSVLQSASYTQATQNSIDQVNHNYRGAHITINVSSVAAGNYTPHIQGKDVVSGLYYDILVGTAISSIGLTVLKVYPGITTSANVAVSDILPRNWRVQMVGAASQNLTFSVEAHMVL